jgi:hypothetical protein
MDPFDTYFIGKTLGGRFKVLKRHEVIHEAPTACRTYEAQDDGGNIVFVKVLVPDASMSLDEQRRRLPIQKMSGLPRSQDDGQGGRNVAV